MDINKLNNDNFFDEAISFAGEGTQLFVEKEARIRVLAQRAASLYNSLGENNIKPIDFEIATISNDSNIYIVNFFFDNPVFFTGEQKEILAELVLLSDEFCTNAVGYLPIDERLDSDPKYESCIKYTFSIHRIWEDWHEKH